MTFVRRPITGGVLPQNLLSEFIDMLSSNETEKPKE